MLFHDATLKQIGGTSYQGELKGITEAQLTAIFGQPTPDDATTTLWALEFDDGTIATIYTRGYNADHACTLWTVGGKDGNALMRVQDELDYGMEIGTI